MGQAGEQAGMEKGTAEHTAPIVWPNSLASALWLLPLLQLERVAPCGGPLLPDSPRVLSPRKACPLRPGLHSGSPGDT